ncbi:hypothetical protein M2336_003545 [Sphingobium sp. B1D7B]|uniref:hypothetical protein n=1 Tax=Sphingobium sp. B1D7B TaxID=2940578 RepID=UPI002225042C|nr:hypothetical protein [Sphingobium sp. B1D7B]MCW2406861.1 hypothetical protein [Sphingobium sp. B1D7B]
MANRENELERQRLIEIMKRYLEAVVTKDFRPVEFAPNLRHTENTVELPIGAGMSRTVKSFWKDDHYFVDVKTGQIEFWGIAEEANRQVMVCIRLKIEGTLISEIEALSNRGAGEFFNCESVAKGTDDFHDVIPESERVSREQLIETASLYFDGIERSNGAIVPVKDDALRYVNGGRDAGGDAKEMTGEKAYRALSVADQISRGYYSYIEGLRARRYLVVDVERGIVLCHLLFDHPNDKVGVDGVLPWPEPNSVLAFEAFKVRNGLIDTVLAVGTSLPFGIRSGWGDGESRAIAAFA